MTLHFIIIRTENKTRPPEVVMWFPIPADMDGPESISLPPASQFFHRICKDLAHVSTLSQVEPRITHWSRLINKVKHVSDSHGICADKVVLLSETNHTAFYYARVNVPYQPSRLAFSFFLLCQNNPGPDLSSNLLPRPKRS